MNRLFICSIACLLLFTGCYKDKGNYTYNVPAAPVISGLNEVYEVFIGDTLNIKPTVTSPDPNADLHLQWRIDIPKEFRDTTLTGPALNMVFNLQPDIYNVRLTIADSSNGMKYFRNFTIVGKTAFSTGTLILSREGATSQLTFVTDDSVMYARVYSAINGDDLPGSPQQVIPIAYQYISPLTTTSFWITGAEGDDGGVQIESNSLKKIKTLRNNFFDPPAAARPGYLECSVYGVLQGVVNGKLYVGATQTYYMSEVYGMFGVPAQGDYELFHRAAFNSTMPYFLGYEKNRKQFVAFTNFGSAAYIGTDYQVTDVSSFDPKDVGLDLLHFQQINDNNCFAFGKDANGDLYELKFGAAFMGFVQLTPMHKRLFAHASLVTPTTQWVGTPSEVFYFTSGDKIYRYNPLNQEILPLTTDFGGKNVSMIKAVDNGNTLIAGVEGSVYFLDISVGKFGDVLKRIDNVPGIPVDVTVRTY
jgi:hypothetical protein